MEKHSSALIKKLLAERNPIETAKTRNRMLLAAKIDDGIKAKGWKKKDFAEAMGKEPSVITKWLSGTHNFTSDTLTGIGHLLNIDLLNVVSKEVVVRYKTIVVQQVDNEVQISNELCMFVNQSSLIQQITAEC